MAGSDFRYAQSVQVERPKGRLFLIGHVIESFDHILRYPPLTGRRHTESINHCRQFLGIDEALSPLSRAHEVGAAVTRNLIQPGAHVSWNSNTQPQPGMNERLLQHVLYRLHRPDTIPDQCGQRSLVAPDQGHEGPFVARPKLLN